MQLTTKEATIQIIELQKGIELSARRSVQDAVKIGEILSEQKEILGHGNFLSWVETLPLSVKTIQNYMQLHSYKDKCVNVTNLSDAYKQIESLEAQKKLSEEERKRKLIAEYRKTGIKPEGWDRSLDHFIKKDKEYQEKQAERVKAEFEQREKNKLNREKENKANDLFSDALKNATEDFLKKDSEKKEWQDKIRLSDSAKEDSFMDALLEYLNTLDDDNRKIEACYNIIKLCKGVANELQRKNLK